MIQVDTSAIGRKSFMHLQEMLDSGTIYPSQSIWCNAVVLVQKKDGVLHF